MGMNAFIFGVIICMASSALIPKYLKGSLDSNWPIRPMPGVAGDSDPLGLSRHAWQCLGVVRRLVRRLPNQCSHRPCRPCGRLEPGYSQLGLPPQSPTTSKQVGGVFYFGSVNPPLETSKKATFSYGGFAELGYGLTEHLRAGIGYRYLGAAKHGNFGAYGAHSIEVGLGGDF
jgi:hypothetical protein